MKLIGMLVVGECMIELSGGSDDVFLQGFAGDTFNTAWHARRHLRPEVPVAFFTALGFDAFSNRMRVFFETSGIVSDKIVSVPDRRPGLYMIEQKDGDRHFSYWRDHSAARMLAEDSDALHAAFSGQALIYLSGITLAILLPDARKRLTNALLEAKTRGTCIAFDPNIRPTLWNDEDEMRSTIEMAATMSDVVLPSFDDEATHFGDKCPLSTCDRYATLAGREAEIVVKNGAGPVTLRLMGESRVYEVPEVASLVDATGAGDGFNGGYLAARLMGKPPSDAIDEAIKVSAGVVAHHGAIPREFGQK